MSSEMKLFRLCGSAPVIDMRTGHNATLRPGLAVLSEDAHTNAIATLETECERLRAQVSALQSDANSWQSGYDKGREDGAKAAEGWKGQHARDSAELRKLCAERDALAAELEAVRSALAGDGRDEFEAMCRSQHRNITRDDRPDPPLAWGYANSLTHDRWCGWAAAWKRARALVADRRTNQGGEA